MKSSISTLALAALVTIASLSQANAQTQVSHVNVPFAFDCGSQHFAPGTYTLSNLDRDNLLLRDGKTSNVVLVDIGDGPRDTKAGYVIFRKYGNRYFLAEYHPANSASTMEVQASKKEHIVAREYAANQPEPVHVQLALNEASGR